MVDNDNVQLDYEHEKSSETTKNAFSTSITTNNNKFSNTINSTDAIDKTR